MKKPFGRLRRQTSFHLGRASRTAACPRHPGPMVGVLAGTSAVGLKPGRGGTPRDACGSPRVSRNLRPATEKARQHQYEHETHAWTRPSTRWRRGWRRRLRHHGGGGGGSIPLNRNHVFDSNGPDLRIRGTSQQLFEKYLQLGRDATSGGDRVMAESYFQHAEHYFRILNAMNQAAQQNQQNGQQQAAPRRPYKVRRRASRGRGRRGGRACAGHGRPAGGARNPDRGRPARGLSLSLITLPCARIAHQPGRPGPGHPRPRPIAASPKR